MSVSCVPLSYHPTGAVSKHGACGYRGRRGAGPIHADRGGVRLIVDLLHRLHLFAFAVPVFPGNQLVVFEGCFCLPLAVVKK